MNRMAAGVIAILLVIVCAFGGMLAGAMIGNLIVPANLIWSGTSGPGLMVVGAFMGLIAGCGFGIWAAIKVVDEAKTERESALRLALPDLPPPPPERDPTD
jgi:hypothetical protein